MNPALTDAELFPLLDETAAANLRRLREHPYAPRYNWRTGERLTDEGLAGVRTYAHRVRSQRTPWRAGALPPWVMEFVRTCRRTVPFYRDRQPWAADDFLALPLTRRSDVQREPWSFVPDGQPLEALITYTTSGTTGTRLQIPATPELPNRYLPLIEHALASVGVRLEGGRRVAIVHVCAQRGTVILCSVSSYLGGAGFAKVNLDDADWNDPAHAAKFLDDCEPELYTGDPFALWRLMDVPLRTQPKAIVSAGSQLTPGLRLKLSSHFGCPVIDFYSMNESGPIAFSGMEGVHEILPPDLYVEILDPAGRPCPPGTRGEVLLTGGANVCLPLIRYPTGDFAAMEFPDGAMPRLIGFEGRQPVRFRDSAGRWFSSIDVSTALAVVALPHFALHQNVDSSLTFRTDGDELQIQAVTGALLKLFGPTQAMSIDVGAGELPSGKLISYTNALVAAAYELANEVQ